MCLFVINQEFDCRTAYLLERQDTLKRHHLNITFCIVIIYVQTHLAQFATYLPRFKTSAFLTKVLVLLIAGCVSGFTLVDTLGCVSTLASARGSAAIYMVLTGGDSVRATTCGCKDWLRNTHPHTHTHRICLSYAKLTNMRVIEASRDQSIFGPEAPCGCRVSTITSKKKEIMCSQVYRQPPFSPCNSQ